MSTLPLALRPARVGTAGLLTASTVLVGAIGIHLAEAQTQAVATRTTSTPGSDTSSSDTSSSDTSSSDTSSNGFAAVSPVTGSGAQAQANSSAS